MFIRTTLIKGIDCDPDDRRGLGVPGGTCKVGSGVVFHELHHAASQSNRFVASGWAVTVGVAGWSIGGGHGPFGPSVGLGVDQILEVELVDPRGNVITANAETNPDLLWAIKGGGGSTWGVMTALTLKAYELPRDGFFKGTSHWSGGFCDIGRQQLRQTVERYTAWSARLPKEWSGLVFLISESTPGLFCGAMWHVFVQYVYVGPSEEGRKEWESYEVPFGVIMGETTWQGFDTYWEAAVDQALEPIAPWEWEEARPDELGGVPSVLVSREVATGGALTSTALEMLEKCPEQGHCSQIQLFQSITSHPDSPKDPNVSVSPGFRHAMFHVVVVAPTSQEMESWYRLGPNSYLSESAYRMDGWRERLWGSNYDQLLATKRKYDPENFFWCRHCVGDEDV
jgi:ribonuclease T2